VVSETDPKGKTTSILYTGSNRTIRSTSPVGRHTELAIDEFGRVVSLRRGDDLPLIFTWTDNNLTALQQGNRVLTFNYDSATERLQSVTNALNQITQFTYDSVGRLTELTRPDDQLVRFEYDSNGNLVSVAPPGRNPHRFQTNVLELPASYTPPALANVPNPATYYEWNFDRQLTQVTRPNGSAITFSYEPTSGSLTSLTTPSATYDVNQTLAGQLNSLGSPDNIDTQYSYDQYGRLTQVSVWDTAQGAAVPLGSYLRQYGGEGNKPTSDGVVGADGNSVQSVEYLYDDDGLLIAAGDLTITRSASTGRVTGTQLGAVTDTYAYNSVGELINYEARYSGASVYEIALTRDRLGRVKTRTETLDGVTNVYVYSYDTVGRLSKVTKDGQAWRTYSYDANGNRTGGIIDGRTTSATYDAQDRLRLYNGVRHTFNANGELSRKFDPTTSTETRFLHDAFGQLKRVVLPASVIRYQTDGKNRRIARQRGNTITARYLYMDDLRIAAETSASGAIRKRFVYATKLNTPEYWFNSGGTAFRIISDELGSPRLVLRIADGAVTQIMRHDPFGEVLTDTKPGHQPFGFAGGLYDPDTTLVRFRAREYDPEVGRWLSKDPILFEGGTFNLYEYAANDPINLKDSNGKEPAQVIVAWDRIAEEVGWRMFEEIPTIIEERIIDPIKHVSPFAIGDALVGMLQGTLDYAAEFGVKEVSDGIGGLFRLSRNQSVNKNVNNAFCGIEGMEEFCPQHCDAPTAP
jgi:RHS repeat-associated protein